MKIFLLLIILVGKVQSENIAASDYLQGLQLERQKKYSEAESLYKHALEEWSSEPHPSSSDIFQTYYRLKAIYRIQHRTKDLINIIEQQIQSKAFENNEIGRRDYIRSELISAYIKAGETHEAIQLCERFLREEPGSPRWPSVFWMESGLYTKSGMSTRPMAEEAQSIFRGSDMTKKGIVTFHLLGYLAKDKDYLHAAQVYQEALIDVFKLEEAHKIKIPIAANDYADIALSFERLLALAKKTDSHFLPLAEDKAAWQYLEKKGVGQLLISDEESMILRMQAECYENAGLTHEAMEKFKEVLAIKNRKLAAREKLSQAGLPAGSEGRDIEDLNKKLETLAAQKDHAK